MTDAKLFEQIETALASDKVVYLIHPHCPDAEKRLKTQDAVGLIRNSTLISKRRVGEAVFFRPTKDQFVPALQRYAQLECEVCGRSCRDEYHILKHKIWKKVCHSDRMLCIGCVEKRLGRKLVPADFDLVDTLASATTFPPSERLRNRLGPWLA